MKSNTNFVNWSEYLKWNTWFSKFFLRSILYVFISFMFSLENPGKILSRNLIISSKNIGKLLKIPRLHVSLRIYGFKSSSKLLSIVIKFYQDFQVSWLRDFLQNPCRICNWNINDFRLCIYLLVRFFFCFLSLNYV